MCCSSAEDAVTSWGPGLMGCSPWPRTGCPVLSRVLVCGGWSEPWPADCGSLPCEGSSWALLDCQAASRLLSTWQQGQAQVWAGEGCPRAGPSPGGSGRTWLRDEGLCFSQGLSQKSQRGAVWKDSVKHVPPGLSISPVINGLVTPGRPALWHWASV